MKIPFFMLLVLSTLSLIRAETASNMEPPEGRLLERVPPPSQWTMTMQLTPSPGEGGIGSEDDTKKKVNPSVTTVTKSNNIVLEKTIDENGTLVEVWHSSGWVAMRANSVGWVVSPNSGNTFNATDYSSTDFAGFSWISLKNFSGRQAVMGRRCLVFKDKVMIMGSDELAQMKAAMFLSYQAAKKTQPNLPPPVLTDDNFKIEVEADIDEKTRLPVLLTYKTHEGLKTRRYDFQSADGSLSLPPEVKELIQKYEENQRRVTGRMAPV